MVGGGDSLVWISSSELTENIGETWGSFFLPFSLFLSLIIFLFNLLLVKYFPFLSCVCFTHGGKYFEALF